MSKNRVSSFSPWPLALGLSPFGLLAEVNIGEDFKFQGNVGVTGVPEFQQTGELITAWLPNVYVVAGLFIFFMALIGGFAIITGGGDPKKIEEGQRKLTIALLGFAILFASYWIIQIIQVLTGVPILGSRL